jgi:hypothetical protein
MSERFSGELIIHMKLCHCRCWLFVCENDTQAHQSSGDDPTLMMRIINFLLLTSRWVRKYFDSKLHCSPLDGLRRITGVVDKFPAELHLDLSLFNFQTSHGFDEG